jgi:LmbE family N-acetylglucosaminyl deacetylase
MLEVLEHVPRKALVVCAHPDDAELSAGATLAKWIAGGCEAALAICTDGAAGSASGNVSRSQVATERRREQESAAELLGVRHLEIWGFPDGGLEDTSDLRGMIVGAIRRYQPETILTHDPHTRDRFVHRDHRVVGIAVQDAIYPFARDPLHYPPQLSNGLKPHKARELLMWESDLPNVIVNVSGFVAAQAACLSRHESQVAGLLGDRDVVDWLAERSGATAADYAFAHGEAYRRIVAPK